MQYLTPRSVATRLPVSPAFLRLAPRRILAWLYLIRFAVSAAIFLAAVLVWQRAPRADTLVASVVFATVMLFTVVSALITEVYRRPIKAPLVYSQVLFDLLLVTAIVHVTWDGNSSQFAPLYILVVAVAALLLPPRGVTLISVAGIVLYVGEALGVQGVVLDLTVMLQLVIFALVAFGSGFIGARLHEEGASREALAEELARFRLRHEEVERLHLRAERLEAIAELSASMAHEIKNPLASIRSAVEQIASSPRTTPDERTLVTLAQRESDRLSRLLSSFIDFARVDRPFPKTLDLANIVSNAGELANTHPDKPPRVRIEYEVSRGDLEVVGDEDMLHRALFNLILNAVQASPSDGIVRVEGATLLPHQIDSRAPAFAQGAVAIRIIDQGPGIPEDVRPRLFHPFFTTKHGGNGLGLAIVHRAIEAHRGVVVVDSDTRGSRFTVLLPRP